MPAYSIQFRRGTAADHSAFTGELAEITIDITNNRVVLHDGQTPGGIPLAKVSDLPIDVGDLSDDLSHIAAANTPPGNDIVFAVEKTGEGAVAGTGPNGISTGNNSLYAYFDNYNFAAVNNAPLSEGKKYFEVQGISADMQIKWGIVRENGYGDFAGGYGWHLEYGTGNYIYQKGGYIYSASSGNISMLTNSLGGGGVTQIAYDTSTSEVWMKHSTGSWYPSDPGAGGSGMSLPGSGNIRFFVSSDNNDNGHVEVVTFVGSSITGTIPNGFSSH